ncbi:EamA family transporter [Halopiger aswanensis]|uniref:Transporter family protein n=1 Tax=Halopiger aswanensis TaxID=148449 RepID=A0A3R7GJA2_9EURY|nr:EamA family transporter [Halopiger aswanensis]RKD95713.1 transporter family protein [Halopiger aswanensis]
MRRYLSLSIVACLAYSLVAPLLDIAMTDLPSTVAVFLSNSVMLVVVGLVIVYRGLSIRTYLRHPRTPHIVAMGVLLSVGLLTYYRALELGPVSVVVPIYGLFIVVSSLVGIVAFDETVTPRKVAAIVLSVVAIALMSI